MIDSRPAVQTLGQWIGSLYGLPCGRNTMAQETELKLLLRPETLPALLAHPLLGGQRPRPRRLRNTYVDTPALDLMARGIAVRERRIGRSTLLTVKTAGTSIGGLSVRGEWEGPTRPGQPDFPALLGEHPLATTLAALADELAPVFRTDFTRRAWHLEHAGARIELALDQGHIMASRGTATRREPLLELELELVDGPAHALYELALSLAWPTDNDPVRPGLWLMPSDRSKAQRGLALFLGRGPTVQQPAPAATNPGTDPRQAFRTVAWACLGTLQANLAHLALDADALAAAAFVHHSRAALARLLAALDQHASWLPAPFVATWRTYWQAADRRLTPPGPDATPSPRWMRPLHEALQAPAPGLALLAFARDLHRLDHDGAGAPRPAQPRAASSRARVRKASARAAAA